MDCVGIRYEAHILGREMRGRSPTGLVCSCEYSPWLAEGIRVIIGDQNRH